MRLPLSPRTVPLELPDPITRLVVLGDPHGDLAALDSVLARETSPATAFVSVGDNVGYADGPTSSELCRRLQEHGIPSVYGNHEAWLDADGRLALVVDRDAPRQLTPEARAWCRALPLRLRVRFGQAPDLRVVVVHTLIDDRGPEWTFITNENAGLVPELEHVDLVLAGHTHGPAIHVLAAGLPARTLRLALDAGASLRVPLEPGRRYVVDAGSLARPGHHPAPGRFDLATYAVVELQPLAVSLHAIAKTAGAPHPPRSPS